MHFYNYASLPRSLAAFDNDIGGLVAWNLAASIALAALSPDATLRSTNAIWSAGMFTPEMS